MTHCPDCKSSIFDDDWNYMPFCRACWWSEE